MLNTFSSPVYSLPLYLLPSLLENPQKSRKKKKEVWATSQFYGFFSNIIDSAEMEEKRLQIIASAVLPSPLMTSALGPSIRWILYQYAPQNVLQIQHCTMR